MTGQSNAASSPRAGRTSRNAPLHEETALSSAAYSPEGRPACPFCGQEANARVSENMLAAHEAIEKLISVEPGSDEFWQARREVADFVGGEVDV